LPKKILIVDDETDLLTATELLLRIEGFLVFAASRGEPALEIAHFERPDLIVTDWMMPRMSGLELCRRLRTDPATADIPIIISTALAEPETARRDFDRYLRKPVEFDTLLAAIRDLTR
jgi:CheY-like chemotaxis protein